MASNQRTWERQDPMGDAYLIDPGPVPSKQKADEASQRALRKSTPAPIQKNMKGKK